jgi:hypothetical protein
MKLNEFIKNIQMAQSTDKDTRHTAFNALYQLRKDSTDMWYTLYDGMKSTFKAQKAAGGK